MIRFPTVTWLTLLSFMLLDVARNPYAADIVSPPVSLSGPEQSTSGDVTLMWGASPTSGVTRYELGRGRSGGEMTTSDHGTGLTATLRVVEDGTWQFAVRACVAAVCSAWTPPTSVRIALKFPDYLPRSCPVSNAPVPAQENAGTIAGEAGVSGGQPIYRIPLVVPPGRKGVQPAPALVYTSRGGADIAGVGWSLAASSRIQRCPATPAQDGYIHGIDFSAQDRLCLDDQRLVLVSGTYGVDGSVYRTELDRFARITLAGDLRSPQSGFVVEEKSGTTLVYGDDVFHSIWPPAVEVPTDAPLGHPLAWWLRRRQDLQGNSEIYEYTVIGGQHVLTAVRYTGLGTQAGDRSVEIEYESRPDRRTAYLAGALIRSTQRIRAITSRVAGDVVRRYELEYAVSRATGRSLLVSIQECTTNPCRAGTRWPPTTFAYSDDPPVYRLEDVPGASGENVTITTVSDYDGDGARDVLWQQNATPWSGPAVRSELRYSSGRVEDVTASPWTRGFDQDAPVSVFWNGPGSRGNHDFDQDGVADGLGIRDGHFAIKSRGAIKGSNLPLAAHAFLYVADFDGNGKSDLLVQDPVTRQRTVYLQRAAAPNGDLIFQLPGILFPAIAGAIRTVLLADFDGNGLPDVFVDWTGTRPQTTPPTTPKIVFTYRSGGAVSFVVRELGSLGAPPESFAEKKGRGFVDINGDGLLDMYQLPDQAWFNRGGRFVAAPVTGAVALNLRFWDTVMPMDWDSDGTTDLLVPNQVRVPWCYLWRSNSTEPLEYCSTVGHPLPFTVGGAPYWHDRTIYQWDAIKFVEDGQGGVSLQRRPTPIEAAVRASRPDDHFGDGLPDVLFHVKRLYGVTAAGPGIPLGNYDGPVTYGAKIAHNYGPAPDLLKRVTDGLGAVATWDYQPLSSGLPFYRAHYRTVPDGKHYLFTSSMLAVARFAHSNGVGGTNARTYRYEDAMANNEGRGFLGFRKIIEEEALADGNDLRTTTVFRQEFPFVSAVEEVSTTRAGEREDAAPIERTRNRWNVNCRPDADPSTPTQFCFPFIDESIREVRDLTTRGLLGTTTTTTTYSPGNDQDFGNVSATETRVEDATGRRRQRQVFTYDYRDVQPSSWWITKLRQKTTTVDAADYTEPPRMLPAINPENATQVSTVDYEYYPTNHPSWPRLAAAVIVQRGSSTEEQRTAFVEYDAYGNVRTVTVTGALVPSPRATRRSYTPDGYFLQTETNALGHVTQLMFDPSTGQERSRVDPNGVGVVRRFDAFGRVLDTTATGVAVKKQRIQFCDGSCPALAALRRVTMQDGHPTTTEYIDLLGRVVTRMSTAFDGVKQVSVVRGYDARGHLVAESQPGLVSAGAYFTRYEGFDALGRPTRKLVDRTGHRPDGGAPDEPFVVDYTHVGLTTHITLAGRLTASRTRNALNEVIETSDTTGQRTKYRYDGGGRLVLIEDSRGHQIRTAFNAWGYKLWTQDPDRGRWTFVPNALGEPVRQTDANGARIDLSYDDLGRVRERSVNGRRDATWSYDARAKGLLDTESSYAARGEATFTRKLAYDDPAGRLTETSVSFDGQTFTVARAYDCNGALAGVRYPDGEAVAYRYTAFGYLEREFNPLGRVDERPYRQVLEMTPRGQVAREAYGNGLFGLFDYYASTGQIRRMCVGDAPCRAPVQELGYAYGDRYGNLTSRSKTVRDPSGSNTVVSVREDLAYDALQRLTSGTRNWTTSGSPRRPLTVEYGYDGLGNLTSKTDYATEVLYGDATRSNPAHAGPHAVRLLTKIGQGVMTDFLYDENGNLLRGDGRQVAYSAFDRPIRITEGTITTGFAYDPRHMRYKQETRTRVTRYIEGVYEELVLADATERRTYVGAQVVVSRQGASRRVRWLHPDHLGSTDTITDEHGNRVESHGYSPFGTPWTGTWEDAGGALGGKVTTHGFTGHEHIDQHRLIHMNGRAYDPQLGRFLSVDPIIARPENAQSLNPYSYIFNNPLIGPTCRYTGSIALLRSTKRLNERSSSRLETSASSRSPYLLLLK